MRRKLLVLALFLCLLVLLLEGLDPFRTRGLEGVRADDGRTPGIVAAGAPASTADPRLARLSDAPSTGARLRPRTEADAPGGVPGALEAWIPLQVRVHGLHPSDRMAVSVFDAAGGFLGREEVSGGPSGGPSLVSGWRLPVASTGTVELLLRDGQVLDGASWSTAVTAGQDLVEAELRVPADLDEPVFQDVAGELVVPQAVHDLGWSSLLRLELVPLGDSLDQRRCGQVTHALKVAAMPEGETDLRLFEVPGVAAGTYALRVTPLGHVQELVVERERAPEFLHLDPGPLARSLVTFRGPAGEAVVPDQVELAPARADARPFRRRLEHREDWQAYEVAYVPGPVRLEVRDARLGRHDLLLDLQPGWSEQVIDLERRLTARLSLDGLDGVRRPTDVEVLAEGDGAVRSRRLVTEHGPRSSGARARFLEVDVVGAGTYRARVGTGAGAQALTFHVTVDGLTRAGSWGPCPAR